ncbi:hypothetical protein L3Q82_011415, partial [Scortum barcoo]
MNLSVEPQPHVGKRQVLNPEFSPVQGQEDSGLDKFPMDQYQNSCRLFWILEELLQKSK